MPFALTAARLLFALIALSVVAPHSARAQRRQGGPPNAAQFVHEQWTVEDGLPINPINSVRQARDGYIWATTFDGLVRFDGVRFTVFNTGNTPELPSNRLLTLTETPDGSLWIATEQGQLVRFYRGRFTRIGSATPLSVDPRGVLWINSPAGLASMDGDRPVPIAAGKIPGPVSAILMRRDSTIWIGTARRGLYRLIADRVEHVHAQTSLDSTGIQRLFEDSDGRLWIGADEGVWVDDGRLRRLRRNYGFPNVRGFAQMAGTGAVYAYTEQGFLRVDGDLAPIDTGGIDPFVDVPLVTDADGTVWHAEGRRLYRDEQLVYTLPAAYDDGWAPTMITTLAPDREGSIWLGTRVGGLHRVKPALFTTIGKPEGMVDPNSYPVYEDRAGDIWVGSIGNGLSRIARDGRITIIPTLPGSYSRTNSFDDDGAGHLRVGTELGLYLCAMPAMRCAREDIPGLPGQDVWALFRDSRGRLWAGTSERAVYLESGRWTIPAGWPEQARVRAFAETPDGAIWMGTNGAGVLRFHDGVTQRISEADSSLGVFVRALHVDADGWLWIGTEGRGLGRIDPRSWTGGARTSRSVMPIRASDGLFDETIHQILDDGDGRLWMNTNRGVFWVMRSELIAFANGRTRAIHSTGYTERDGIRNREGNGGSQPAGVRARDGRLWFPTQEGVVVIDPARLQQDRVIPPVVIERVIAGDTVTMPHESPLTLGVRQRDVQIEFTALSFLAPANMRFRYRLEPYDADWVDAGNRRTAFYTRVPPGRYTFRVIASNNAGVWNEEGGHLEFSVAPYIWETIPFRATVMLLALFTAAWGALRWRGRVERRAIELESVVSERTAELRESEQLLATRNEQLALQASKLTQLHDVRSHLFANLSHEFRTPLTLILGPLRGLLDGRHGELGADVREQHGLMLRNGQRLLRLINQVLDLSRLQAGAVTLDKRTHDVAEFARAATLAFAPLADRRGIALRFSSASAVPAIDFDADQIEKVLLNLLSNALKFTERGGEVEVIVRALPDESGVLVAVRDTGVGIPADALPRVFERFYQADSSPVRRYEGTGIGLALAKELVELHGGEIGVVSTVGIGSTFSFMLPRGAPNGNGAHRAPTPMQDDHVLLDLATPVAGSSTITGAPAGVDTADLESEKDQTAVLVIDDNADVRAYVRSVLSPTYRVLEAPDGAAGLDSARARLPDCIVADVMMPGMDGLTLSRALKDDAMTDAIPVILLTARATTEDHVAGLETGVDAYLIKPFDPAVLEATVANLLAQRRRLREHFNSTGAPLESVAPAPAAKPRSELEEKLRSVVRERLTDPELGAESLAQAMGMSYQQLYRAMREAMDTSATRFIRGVRVECAAELLRRSEGSVTEVAYSVGFESLSYFSRAYRERFGVPPSAHLGAERGPGPS